MAAPSAAVEQIGQAEAYKEQGNRHYGEGSFKKALGAYHKVFCYINGLQVPPAEGAGGGGGSSSSTASGNYIPKERVEDVKKLKQSTKLNMAACYLKLGEHQKCLDACTSALEFGNNSKAFFRRGQARCELRDFGGARSDLERARELAPDDPGIPAELRRLRARFDQADDKERQQCAKMFAEAPADPRSTSAPSSSGAPPGSGAAAEEEEEGEAATGLAVAEAAIATSFAPGAAAAAGIAAGAASGRGSAAPGEDGGGAAPPPPGPGHVAPLNTEAVDEVRKLDFAVRELKYAWQQTEEDIKIYISFDQSDELQDGVDESRVEVEFGEWNMLLLIKSAVERRPPFGLRLGDFHRRVAPERCRCTVRSSRITVKLAKQVKEHWWNFLQSTPLHTE